MSRKDYILIAGIIKELRLDGDEFLRESLIEDFEEKLLEDNSRFDKRKFRAFIAK